MPVILCGNIAGSRRISGHLLDERDLQLIRLGTPIFIYQRVKEIPAISARLPNCRYWRKIGEERLPKNRT